MPSLSGQNLFEDEADEEMGIYVEPPLPENPQAPSGIRQPAFVADPADIISLAGPWLYRPENLLPPRNAAQGGYIPLPHTGETHPWADPDLAEPELQYWQQMLLPGAWEDQAFAFDGIIWFRQELLLPLAWEGQDLEVNLGTILGRDEVFFNGQRIGATAPAENLYRRDPARVYQIPGELVRRGENTLAIRLIDTQEDAGLIGWPGTMSVTQAHPPAAESGAEPIRPQILDGPWQFAVESYDADSPSNLASDWHRADFDDSSWQSLVLPGALGDNRFDYDGIIFFRKEIDIPDDWAGSPLTLELGRIADTDATFFNGTLIGSTENGFNHAPLRKYMVPAELVRPGNNVVTVRVFNGQFKGGLLGPPQAMRLSYGWSGIVAIGDSDASWEPDISTSAPSASIEIGAGFDSILEDVQEKVAPLPKPKIAQGKLSDREPLQRPATRKWPVTFPQSPADTERMTAADLPGPDDVVYPDFRRSGLPADIPAPGEVFEVEKFGGYPGDKLDDTQALQQAITAAEKSGGGVVLLAEGEWLLSHPVFIRQNGVIIRGAGAEKTRILFQTELRPHALNIIQPRETGTLTLADYVEVQANPDGLQSLQVYLGTVLLGELSPTELAGAPYSLGRGLEKLRARLVDLRNSETTLRAVATWQDGTTREVTLPVTTDFRLSPQPGSMRSGPASGALIFRGGNQEGDSRRWFLAKDAKRGDTWLELTDVAEFPPGRFVQLSARSDDDWINQIESARPSVPRIGRYIVEEIDRKRVRLNQPLRQDFPAAAEAGMLTLPQPIRFAGVEDLSLEQRGFLPFDGIILEEAYGCWVRNVHVQRIGRRPVLLKHAKFCEIRDSHFSDTWNSPESGAGHVGFETSWDCLIDNVVTERLPNSPSFAWGASGNVIRNSQFLGSGAVFPQGWATENLVENTEIDAGSGRYAGPAIVTAAPDNPATGPGGGPRNVFYNNHLRGTHNGVQFGGMESGWMFVQNQFLIRSGSLVQARMHSVDHVFQGNVISLAQPWQPALRLDDADCVGTTFQQNIVYGVSRKTAGPGQSDIAKNEWIEGYLPEPPTRETGIPSLSIWQKENFPLKKSE